MSTSVRSVSRRVASLAAAAAVLIVICGAHVAVACKPGEVKFVTIAPARVFVPIGGTANMRTVVRCNVDGGDWTAESTTANGGRIQFDVRLIDEDSGLNPDDVLGTVQFNQTFNRQLPVPPGFARPVQGGLSFTVRCPADVALIVGDESSGEGAPACSDPADGALEIDHGNTTENTNYYAGNLGGYSTVPICCSLLTEDEVNQTSKTRKSLTQGGGALRAACEEEQRRIGVDALAPKRQDDVVEPCHDPQFLAGLRDRAEEGLGLGGQSASLTTTQRIEIQQGTIHLQFIWKLLADNPLWAVTLVAALARPMEDFSGGDAKQQSTGILSISGPAPIVPVTGTLAADGTFVATGRGTVAGFPNVTVDFRGTYVSGRLSGLYRFGAANELPQGVPMVVTIDAESAGWKALLTGTADHLLQAGQGLAQINFRAPYGGVDFSEPLMNVAGHLLNADLAVRFGEIAPPPPMSALLPPGAIEQVIPDQPDVDSFRGIAAELNALADAAATSTLVSRVQLETAIRGVATLFNEAATQRAVMNRLAIAAPSDALVSATIDWIQALGSAGGALEVLPALLLGADLATVSAADYSGPTVAPDSIVSGFGPNLAGGIELATTVPLPTSLSGVSIRVTDSAGIDRLAGLFFSSTGQFNFHIPAGTAPGQAILTAFSGDRVIATGRTVIRRVAPSIFTANASGSGVPAALAQHVAAGGEVTFTNVFSDGALGDHAPVPIDLGAEGDRVFLLLFGTGIRAGQTVTATVGGRDAPVLGFAPSSEFVGLDQVNVELLRSFAGSGTVDVKLTVDTFTANTVTIAIQ